ncbi:copper-binding periplasmic metallochaperone CueP [Pectobacterium jejuense]|uniref:copper-binding periplasmic metallochaperone CueP n=1 Tax=Pectobacterium jejuense TaxID=2974022 RepID=UPI00196994F3|nr:copper-binding periplasmic metallochaperone CueP [Pectobacterium polaris]MBN3081650.1 copper-binding periplasmic metallochaperone CueP [Pectobacterium polaris]
MMKIKMMAALLALTLSGPGFAAATDANAFLAKQGLAGKSVEQIVDTIDQSPHARPLPYSASITSKELKLSDGQQQYSYPLGNKFYLSFAPYIQQTHPCFNHSLSGCQGELANTAFDVKITDKAGNVIVQKTLSSHQNGFVGVWLPRNIEGTINVTYQGRAASSPFATYDDSQTCMTTLPLKEA